jgi:hypothetical protein
MLAIQKLSKRKMERVESLYEVRDVINRLSNSFAKSFIITEQATIFCQRNFSIFLQPTQQFLQSPS